MYEIIVPQHWMLLPKEIRDQIAKDFKLTKTGVSEIRDQEVVSDGYSQDDLRGITLDKMCEYIGSQETFMRAWEITQAKAKSILHPPTIVIGTQLDADKLNEIKSGEVLELKEVANEEFEKTTGQPIKPKKNAKV